MTYHLHHHHHLLFFLLLTIIIPSTYSSSLQLQPQPQLEDDDLHLLLSFKNLSDPTNALSSWNLSYPPSSWLGLTFTFTNNTQRVTRIVLENLSLTGPSGLSLLTVGLRHLRVLSLKSNSLSGPLPSSLSNLLSLKLLFLSSNLFSGPIPSSLTQLSHLYRLDLSHNNFSGPLPQDLNRLTRLITLRLDSNSLSGPISSSAFAFLSNNNNNHNQLLLLQALNLSSNSLSGPIPPSLSSFPASAFQGNLRLCGPPLLSSTCTKDLLVSSSAKSSPGSGSGSGSGSAVVVSSSPAESKPEARGPTHGGGVGRGINRLVVLAIVVGDFVVLLLVSAVLFCYFWRKIAARSRTSSSSHVQQGEKIVYSSTPYASSSAAAYDYDGGAGAGAGGGGFERGKMVFLDREKRFELEDLLKASAEMLGKGGHGTAYRAVLHHGTAVAVKRLREVQIGRREFQSQMELLGRLLHPNLVPLKAYYYSRDEKLLVLDYMPGGSLFSLLHGNRGPSRTPLDWTSRVHIATGAARGLAFIHHNSRSTKLAHGNVKSTNILIDKGGYPRLADFGLAQLVPCPHSLANGYRAPESSFDSHHRASSSQKADIYALGIVLLEILTGKSASEGEVNLPRWVQSVVREEWTSEVFDLELMRYKGIEEEMVAMLQIAMACVATAPEQRPKVGHVVRMIEEIHGGGEVSPLHESFDSVSDSPSTSEDARTIRSQ